MVDEVYSRWIGRHQLSYQFTLPGGDDDFVGLRGHSRTNDKQRLRPQSIEPARIPFSVRALCLSAVVPAFTEPDIHVSLFVATYALNGRHEDSGSNCVLLELTSDRPFAPPLR